MQTPASKAGNDGISVNGATLAIRHHSTSQNLASNRLTSGTVQIVLAFAFFSSHGRGFEIYDQYHNAHCYAQPLNCAVNEKIA